MAKLKAAFITDVHYGFDIGNNLGSKAPRLMKAFIRAVNKFLPDIIIDGGDRVSAKSEERDRRHTNEYLRHFNEAAAPLEYIDGNHDAKNLGRRPSYSKDIGGFHLVFWNPNVDIPKTGLRLDAADLEWLRRDLAKTDKKTILFSHVPLDNVREDEETGIDRRFYYGEGGKARQILEESGKIVLCLHGHHHRNRHREINGIHYITQQSFTQEWREKYRIPAGAFSFIEADDDKITIRLQGKHKKTYELNLI